MRRFVCCASIVCFLQLIRAANFTLTHLPYRTNSTSPSHRMMTARLCRGEPAQLWLGNQMPRVKFRADQEVYARALALKCSHARSVDAGLKVLLAMRSASCGVTNLGIPNFMASTCRRADSSR